MDILRLNLMTLDDHYNYPDNCVSVEGDIQHLHLITDKFASQSDHPDAQGLAFVLRLFPDQGIGSFMFQPGAANRIWMPCMRILLSVLQVNPSFPHLVGTSHLSSFGSYIRRNDTDQNPTVLVESETWWSISAPRTWPADAPVARELTQNPGFRRLFDIRLLAQNRWAIFIWRTSICVQYDIQNKTFTIVSLDEGGNFREGRFERTMSQRQELDMKDDPFSIHLLFLSEAVQDWTFSFEVLQREIDKEQDIAFDPDLRRDQFEAISRRLHDLLAYQLKYQSHLASMRVIMEGMSKEHDRFRKLVDTTDRVFDRVENNLQRLQMQVHSIYEHSIRMEKQTHNIQKQLLELTNLEIAKNIGENSVTSIAIQDGIRLNTETIDRLVRGIEGLLDSGT
ncbi:hypothetical protein B0J11DRAFT_601974 [Dendryphion nanum]|uniref:Uncharacterized protein n=1 Tax=Dendryphion nanum TaxID=256645 RepID=A0A9P9CXX9_9PLEO|nr:hypothetical protein B0J11DRAFT_601974 [Dendryphion nanum]